MVHTKKNGSPNRSDAGRSEVPTIFTAKDAAIAALRAYHEGRISSLVDEIEDGFRLGKWRGFRPEEVDLGVDATSPLFALEDEVEKRLVACPEDAAIVLLASPTGMPAHCEDEDPPSCIAAAKATHDVLREALRRGLYKPARGERPSAPQLRSADRRAA